MKVIAVLVMTFSMSMSCYAADLVCSGKVEELSYHANNKFMLKLSSMNRAVFFCNPDSEWSVSGASYKTGPETCKMMYSTFLAAKTSGKEIKSVYFDGNEKPNSCSEFEPWSSVNIRYFRLD